MNQIITGNCLDVMAEMQEESVGMIVTSPPYNAKLNYEGFDDDLPEEEFIEFNRTWLKAAYRVAKDTARLYAVIGDKMFWWFRECAESAGWTYVQKLTWCKPNFVGRKISGDWNYMSEDILLFRKGKRTPMLSHFKVTTHNWMVETVPQSNFNEGRIHPAQMPFSLCYKIIARTPGEPVLDPFAGSGQVLRAARALGRAYLGVELVPAVANKARLFLQGQLTPRGSDKAGRLEETLRVEQMDLFDQSVDG